MLFFYACNQFQSSFFIHIMQDHRFATHNNLYFLDTPMFGKDFNNSGIEAELLFLAHWLHIFMLHDISFALVLLL